MKELSIEEKAKRYDKALERARDVYTYYCDDREQLRKIESIFPELKESENEKIRKELISYIKQTNYDNSHTWNGINLNVFIAWLEKQGEHANFLSKIQVGDKVTRNEDGVLVNLSQLKRVAKPADKQGEQKPAWSEKDENMLDTIIDASEHHCMLDLNDIDWLKSLKDRIQPKQEWSEEDEKAINDIMWIIEAYRENGFNETHIQMADNSEKWLMSLRPQNTWKPSDEQMKALADALSLAKNCGEEIAFDLRTLYEQLKKLRKE